MVDSTDYKSAFASRAVWGGIIAILASALGLWGYSISPDDQARIIDIVVSLGGAVGGAMAIYGRIKATKKIG